ncbi:MAG TPA: TonB-dependent receptor [Pyrinomonadaceae bacterium]|nr:TonB-dependent receptor [Pyrinomonadaceae bacterium]
MKKFTFAVLILCMFAVSALAQSNTGTLVGTVSGPDGAIAGATVTLMDSKTGKERTVTAGGEGSFSIPQLDPGTYTVKITAQGFKTFTATDVKIDVGREYSLKPVLEVGNINETVTVVAGADVLNSTNAELSNTVSQKQLADLPLNGRNPLGLIGLQAGVASNGAQGTSINGQRSTFTNITRDGINIQDNYIRGNAVDFTPDRATTDDISEFTITTQNASSDKGYGASQIQEVTPRGDNDWHGGGWIYNRNNRFAANTFFRNRSGIAKDPLNQNQVGAKLAGPIIKNKLFFFAYYEAFRRTTTSTQNRTILLPSARSGIFTYVDNAGVARTVNLFTAFGGSTGITGVNPVIQTRFLTPTPSAGNNTSIGDQLNTTGFTFAQQGDQKRDGVVTRIDYDANEHNTFSGVYSFKKDRNLRPDAASNFDAIPDVFQPNPAHLVALAWRWTPTARLTNELRGGMFREHPLFNNTSTTPANFITPTLISNPEETFLNQGRESKNYNIQDNADYTWGDHSLRFGGLFQAFRVAPFQRFGIVPTFTIGTNVNTPQITTTQFGNAAIFPGGISTGQRATANALLALLGGIVNGGTATFNVADQASGFVPNQEVDNKFAYENFALYLTDQWRVRSNLTLNFGLRYDLYTPVRETQGLFLEPAIGPNEDALAAVLNPNGQFQFIGGNAGGNNRLYRTDKKNFAPSISFAYTPNFKNKFLGGLFGDGRTVIRGGYSISYVNDDFVVSGASNTIGLNAGLSTTANAVGTLNPATGSTALNGRADALPTIPSPAFGTFPRPFSAYNTATFNFFNTVFGVDPHLQTPSVQQYNFGFQREIGFQTAIEIRYVGARSNNLPRAIDYNQLEIRSNGFLADFNRALSNCIAQGATRPGAGTPLSKCTDASFNPGIAGSQPLTVFPLLPFGGLLNNSTIVGLIQAGVPTDLVQTYIQNNLAGTAVPFRANPQAGGVDLLQSTGILRYNALQVEVRRRFSKGLLFQANYTFQKTLGNAFGTANAANNNQSRFEPNLDNANPQLEYARADYDAAHVFNVNATYELPFGKGKRWLNQGGLVDRVLGGFEVTSIVQISSGAPLTITDPRSTLNRANRSSRQTAVSSLSGDAIKNLIGVFRTPCGPYFINPAVININQQALAEGRCTQLGSGRAANGFGQPTFAGQVFFNNDPGGTGNLPRAFLNGPTYANWDLGFIKNIRITERTRLQLRGEAFNVLNRTNLAFTGTQQLGALNINSTNFGKITTAFSPRILQFAARFEF